MITHRYRHCQVIRNDDGAVIYGEKGRLSRLGVYIVHLSVICLILGGLVGSFFGFEAFVTIPEGEATDVVRIRNTGALHRLDFQIRCDDFNLTLYKNGAPKEYRSTLTILEGGKPVLQKDIIVNDPLRYRGINIFQSSYGQLPPEQVSRPAAPAPGPADSYTLSFTSKSSGMSYTRSVKVGMPVDIPEGLGQFLLVGYEANAVFRGMAVGAALKGLLTPPGGQAVEVLLPLKFANFDKMRGGAVVISVIGSPEMPGPAAKPAEPRYYTGLQVTRDPGVGLVYFGFVMMIAGCFVTFYLSHQQVCIVLERRQKTSRVILAGVTNRNKLAMQNVIEKIFGTMTKA
ncbi:cytochrome c biogenesis protein ResB [Desulfosarcina cetonica]|uniref:cytochrome c biogenesis protein ResB n=1 Tax=Desulfosarcina cetonica TaxID=90730 RepID=UPI00278C0B84|nr:cytochrome c biogenesis protein ResB [Desulfosarcina cetonica]